jgi:predicted Rdx family selenoprotein
LAAAIKKETGLDAKLVKGKGGIFDVILDGKTVLFSKHEVGRFPEADEVLVPLVEKLKA